MVKRLVMVSLLASLLGSLSMAPSYAAGKQLDGHWEGAITQPAGELKIMVDFMSEGDAVNGTFDLPAAAVFHWPLRTNYSAPKVKFRLPTGVAFDGELQGDTISGKVPSPTGGHVDAFYLRRKPLPPLPYKVEDVRFQSGGVTLAGTLRLPLSGGMHSALFLLQGSGGADRDAESFYADHFARHGIATLVYDKRGVGDSTGNWETASFDDFAGDALAGVRYLQSRKEINPKRVGLYGRSHGAMVAPLAASRSNDVAFIVNVSGNGMPVTQNIIYGVEANMRAAGFSESDINEAAAYMRQRFEVARTGQGWDTLKAKIDELQSSQVKWLSITGTPKDLDTLQFFWKVQFSYDPIPHWQKAGQPVLALYGGMDNSQPVTQIATRIGKALTQGGNKKHTIRIFPNADHALLVWPKPNDSFHWPVLAAGYLDTMTNWIMKHAAVSK
jgi:hypothetical protein